MNNGFREGGSNSVMFLVICRFFKNNKSLQIKNKHWAFKPSILEASLVHIGSSRDPVFENQPTTHTNKKLGKIIFMLISKFKTFILFLVFVMLFAFPTAESQAPECTR